MDDLGLLPYQAVHYDQPDGHEGCWVWTNPPPSLRQCAGCATYGNVCHVLCGQHELSVRCMSLPACETWFSFIPSAVLRAAEPSQQLIQAIGVKEEAKTTALIRKYKRAAPANH